MKNLLLYIHLLFAFVLAILCAGCKVCEPIVKTEYRDSVRTEYRRDSVRLVDSVFVDRWRENDTVFINKTKYCYLYRDILHTDTITIDNSTTETVQVKYVPPFYKGCTIALWCLVIISLIYIALRIVKAIYLRR